MIPLHALFQRRIDGDDALLRLARLRFEQAGLAAEVYGGSAAELEWMLRFAPQRPRPPMVHLPRDVDLLDPAAAERIGALVRRFGTQVSGFVVHDRQAMPDRLPELVRTAQGLSATLVASGGARLFVEYAAGLRPERFVAIGEALRDVERVGVCVDTGHVGIRAARRAFAGRPGCDRLDLAALDPAHPDLPALLDDVRAAVGSALVVLLDLVEALGAQGKAVHFHLHDGHPLIRGLSDHFGFLLRVPLPFDQGDDDPGVDPGVDAARRSSLDPLYGVTGLQRIVATVHRTLGPSSASFTLEIHEHQGRLPLPPQDAERLFPHWRDPANAERMNLWLRELAENATLVRAVTPGAS